jgi:hypothetical protein
MMQIPDNVKTSLVDIAMDISELNIREGERMCVLIADQPVGMTIMGCNCISDVIFYSNYFNRFEKLLRLEDLTIVKALIADPTDLPFNLLPASSAFVINEKSGIKKLDSMEEVTQHIELMLSMFEDINIDDFAVLIGVELSDFIKNGVISKLEAKRLKRYTGT